MNLTNRGNELLFINFNQDFRYCGALLFQDTMYSLAHGLNEGAWTNFFSLHAHVPLHTAAFLSEQSEDSKYTTAIPLANAIQNVTRTVLLASFLFGKAAQSHKLSWLGNVAALRAKEALRTKEAKIV